MPKPSRRESKKLQRRNSILVAAEELFSEKGFKGTTMQEVSGKAGLSKGTVYLYFKSKEELYLSVCVMGIAGFGERLEAAGRSAKGLEERIKAVYLAYIKHSLGEPAVFRVLRDTFIEQVRQNLSRSTIEEITGFIRSWLENESRLVQQGIDSGIFDTGLDPYAFSLLAWRMSTGLIELALLKEPIVVDLADLDRMFEKSIDMLIKGARA
jgi:AcrR family transcriptional regulator